MTRPKSPVEEITEAAHVLEIMLRRNLGPTVKPVRVIVESAEAVDLLVQSAEYGDRLKYTARAPSAEDGPRSIDWAGFIFRDADVDVAERHEALKRLDLVVDELTTAKGSFDSVRNARINELASELHVLAHRIGEPRAHPLERNRVVPVLLPVGPSYVKVPATIHRISEVVPLGIAGELVRRYHVTYLVEDLAIAAARRVGSWP